MLVGSAAGAVLLAATAAPGGNRSSASGQTAPAGTHPDSLPAARTDGEEKISYRFTAFDKRSALDFLAAGKGSFTATITGSRDDHGRGQGTGLVAYEVERVADEDTKLQFSVGVVDFVESLKVTKIHLGLRVTQSNDDSCPKGRRGEAVATDIHEKGKPSAGFVRIGICRYDHVFLDKPGEKTKQGKPVHRVTVTIGRACLRPSAFRAPSSAQSGCADTPAAQVTLTVNGRSLTGKPVINAAPIPVASATPLSISCSIPEELPKGWSLEVFHAADPLSPGNGVYYKVVSVTAGDRCPATTRPGVDANAQGGDVIDHVWVQLLRPDKSVHASADMALVFKKA